MAVSRGRPCPGVCHHYSSAAQGAVTSAEMTDGDDGTETAGAPAPGFRAGRVVQCSTDGATACAPARGVWRRASQPPGPCTPGEETDRNGATGDVRAGREDADRHQRPRHVGAHPEPGEARWARLDSADGTGTGAFPRLARAPANVTTAGRPALDARIRQGAVLPPPPGFGEGRRDGGHAGGVAAVGTHRWGTRHRHAGQSKAYRASKEELTFVAFYPDCRHQVTPVRSGYRATLTFNLLSATESPAPEADPATELAHCLTEHFTTPATPRYGSRDLGLPNRLV